MDHTQHLYEMLSQVTGYIYPNELPLQWGVLVVLYPYITGLVAGAFILASLERVFKIKVLKPTYELALLTALAFLICAPLPLVSHLGKPLRAYEIMITPNKASLMIPPLILDCPSTLSVKIIGISLMVNPRREVVYFISIWNAYPLNLIRCKSMVSSTLLE